MNTIDLPQGKVARLENGNKVAMYPMETGYFLEFTNNEGEVRPISLSEEAMQAVVVLYSKITDLRIGENHE